MSVVTLEAVLPDTAVPGATVRLSHPDGRQVEVLVPPDYAPGSVLTVTVPATETMDRSTTADDDEVLAHYYSSGKNEGFYCCCFGGAPDDPVSVRLGDQVLSFAGASANPGCAGCGGDSIKFRSLEGDASKRGMTTLHYGICGNCCYKGHQFREHHGQRPRCHTACDCCCDRAPETRLVLQVQYGAQFLVVENMIKLGFMSSTEMFTGDIATDNAFYPTEHYTKFTPAFLAEIPFSSVKANMKQNQKAHKTRSNTMREQYTNLRIPIYTHDKSEQLATLTLGDFNETRQLCGIRGPFSATLSSNKISSNATSDASQVRPEIYFAAAIFESLVYSGQDYYGVDA